MINISVIIPVYKSEKYLARCLDSILNQSHQRFEVICVDDCSPDNSLLILKDYAKKDDRIKIVEHKVNQGISAARNSGLKQATGDYISFLDNDDIMHPQFFELMLANLIKTNSDFVWCEYKKFRNDEELSFKLYDNICGRCFNDVWNKFLIRKRPHPSITVWNKLFNKDLLQNIYFNENISIGEDFIFSHYYLCNTKKACYLETPLIFYRKHSEATSNDRRINRYLDNYYEFCEVFLLEFVKSLVNRKEINNLQSRVAKMVLEQFIKRPYCQDRKNCEQYWNIYGDKLKQLFDNKLIESKNIGLKYVFFSYLLTNKKFKTLRMICTLQRLKED